MHVSGTSFANQYYNSTPFSDSKLHLGDRKGIQPVRNLCQLSQKALVWRSWYNLIPQKRQLVKQQGSAVADKPRDVLHHDERAANN